MSDEKDARRQVAVANRLLAEFGLAAGVTMSLGHVSMRVPDNPDTFWVKGRGYEVDALALMRPEDMVLCDLDGNLLEAAQGVSQCSEVKIHSCLYKARPDVLSVVHVHPRYAVLLSVLGTDMVPVCREGMPLVGQPIPVYPDVALITTEEEGVAVAETLGSGRVVLLLGHGAVAVGASPSESVMTMLQLEEQARMNFLARSIAGPDYPRIPEELIVRESKKPPMSSLPHFKDRPGVVGGTNGAYEYYAGLVATDL